MTARRQFGFGERDGYWHSLQEVGFKAGFELKLFSSRALENAPDNGVLLLVVLNRLDLNAPLCYLYYRISEASQKVGNGPIEVSAIIFTSL